VGDARELPQLLDPRVRISTIVTSPPYGGTYDYQAQHALRLAWLGIDTSEFLEGEIGSRRANLSPKAGVARWNEELVLVLRSMRTVLDDRGRILVLIGDGEVGGEPVPALRQLLELAPHADLEVVAAASVERPDFRLPGGAREEHAIALRPR
jgi:tRNA G10  N-methylase Trm11